MMNDVQTSAATYLLPETLPLFADNTLQITRMCETQGTIKQAFQL